jgi:type IV pilus assembly protein PilP
MRKYYRSTLIISGIVCITIFINAAGSSAGSGNRPVVIRQKIKVQQQAAPSSANVIETGSEHKKPAFAPVSDLAELKKNEAIDEETQEILRADYSPQNQPPTSYNPSGKVDPFEPLFKKTSSKKEDIVLTPKPTPKGHVPGELEKIDLSQLKLTGIIIASDRNLGLVQEASGKGYVISKGTHIGTRGGRVSAILKNKVIIKETMVSADGRTLVQEKELRLRNKTT